MSEARAEASSDDVAVQSNGRQASSTTDELPRERIIRAAAELAALQGVTATTTDAVCRHSGLPISSLYWHFSDKDELFAEVIRAGFAEWVARLAPPATGPAASHEDCLRSILGTLAFQDEEIPEFVLIGLEVLLDKRDTHKAARLAFIEARAQWQRMFVTWVTSSLNVSERSRLGHSLAIVCMAFSEGMIINLRLRDDIKLKSQVDILVMVLLGILRDPAAE